MKTTLFASIVIGIAASAALAVDCVWTGGAAPDNRWAEPLNWQDGAWPQSNQDNAIFPDTGGAIAVLLDASQSIRTVYFRNPSGTTLTVASGVNLSCENNGALIIRAEEDAVIDGPGTLTFSAGNGEDWADNQAAPGKTLTINAKITGEKGFEHNGTGGLIVLNNAANDFEGCSLITAGGGIAVSAVVANTGVPSQLGKANIFKFRAAPSFLRYTGGTAATDLSFTQDAGTGADATIEHTGTGTLTFNGQFYNGNANGHAFIFDVADPAAVIDLAGGYGSSSGNPGLWLYRRGAGTLRISSATFHDGMTVVEPGGPLDIAPSGSLSADSLVNLRGGTIRFCPAPASVYTAALGTVQAGSGVSTIAIAPGAASATLTLGALVSAAGAIDFTAADLGGADKIFISGQPSGLIGAWATVNNGAALAAYDPSIGVHAASVATQSLTALGPSVIQDNAASVAIINAPGTGGGITLAADPTAVILLSQETATPAAVSFGGGTLVSPLVRIALGGAGLTLGDFAGDGVLLANAASDNGLILANANAPGGAALTVNAAIADNGADPTRLNKNGPGDVVLAGPVAHTGGTGIGEGALTVFVDSGMSMAWPEGGISGGGGLTKTGDGTLLMPDVGNTYGGTTTVSRGTISILHRDTFGDRSAPTVIEDGGAIALVGTGSGIIRFDSEHIFAQGAGPDGRGAILCPGPHNHYEALRLLTLTGDLTVYASERFDLRNAGGAAVMDLNGHTLTKKGPNHFVLVEASVINDQGTASFDILEGSLSLEASTNLSDDPANVVRVRDGGTLDYWNLYRPANWTLSIDGGGRTFTRGGFGAGTINTWAGPVTLTGGEATFASGTENLLAFSDTYTGVISGPGKLVKAGSESGVTYLLGTNNTWAGGTRIDNGILYAVAPGALPGYATDTEVHNRGTLALRVADAAGANPGFALSEIRDLLNNPLTFRSANASLGFETAYEDLLYTDPYPHAGIRKLGPNTLTLTDLGPNLGPIGVYGGTLDLSAANSYIDDNTILIGESAPAADPPATLILGAGARLTTLDRGYQGSPQPMVIVGNTGRGTLHVSDDAFINGRVILGNSAAAAGAVYQTGGTVHNTGGEGNDGHIGNQGYGYYLLAGGLYDNKGYSQVARNSSSVGILHQTGGTFNYVGHTGEGGYNGCYGISRGGIGVVNVEGGEFNSRVTLWVCDQNEGGNAGYAEFTVSGDAEVSINGQISMGERDGGTVGMLNLNGGEVNAERVWRANRGGNQVYVNWGGGLFRATSVTPELFAGDILPDVLLHGGGAVIDIPDTGKSKIIYAPLCAPEKLGLISIPVATGGAGYLGSPFVRLTGGGGRGASAFARVEGGEVTEIVVTSPGTGYSSSPVATLVGGGAATAATLGSPILGVVPPGGLTKLGHGLLTLGAANTYTGPTEVREGTLLLKHEAALAPASGIAVTGGTLDLGGATLSNGAVTVTGGAILNGTLATHAINKDGPGTLALSAFTVPAPPPPPPSPLTPGLWEGMIRSSWDTGTLNPKTSLQLTTRAANGGPQASNATYADGAWAGNYHTWVYTGCIWNRTDEDVDWTFFGRFDDNMRLTIDNAYVLDNGNGEDRFATYRLTPGPHFFEARFGDGEGEVGPGPRDRPAWPATGPMSGLLVDYSGQPGATEDLWRFQILEDPGDGSLFTAEVPPLEDGPGLFESVIRQNWNTLDDGTPISRQTTLRAGSDGPVGPNTTYADGMWAGNNHTWIYKGYIWNRTAEDFVWTWSFTFDDNVMLKIDGVVIRDVILSEGVQIQPDVRIPPGPHEIEIRFGDGGGDVGPHGGFPSGLMYDPLNRASWDPNDYTPLEDLGDGDLLTTSLDWAPAEEGGEPEPSLVRVNVSEGTLLLDHAPTPGLHEGRLDGQFNTADPNPMTAIEFTTTAANGWCDSGGEINGKHWPDNSTYVYTGYIWNRDPTNVTWTFAENFDDNVLLVIDGATVLHDTSWDTPTYGTITLTPGPHPFEARFGQGGGGAGGNIVPNPDNPDPERNRWDWPDKNVAFLIDYQGRDEGVFANYELLQDDGTGRLLTCTAADPLDPTLPYAALQVSLAPGATLDLGGRARQVGEITGDGAIANGALAAGTVISPGGDDAIGTLALDNVTFGPGVTYRLTTDGAASDCITSASALDLRGVTVVPATGDLPTASAYVIATAPAFTGLPALDGFPSKYKTMKRGTDLLLTSKFGTLLILR